MLITRNNLFFGSFAVGCFNVFLVTLVIFSGLEVKAEISEYQSTDNLGLNKKERIDSVEKFLTDASSSIKKIESKMDTQDSKIKNLEEEIEKFKEKIKKLESLLPPVGNGDDVKSKDGEKREATELEKIKADILSLKNQDIEKIKLDLQELKDSAKKLHK